MNMVGKITWIPICCVCHQVRDDRQSREWPTRNGFEQWMSLRSFLRLYRVSRVEYQLTHTYCARCMEQMGFDRPSPERGSGNCDQDPSRRTSGGGS